MRRDDPLQVRDDTLRRDRASPEIGAIAKQHEASIAQCRRQVDTEKRRVGHHVALPRVHEHRHRISGAKRGICEAQRDGALSASRPASQQMHATRAQPAKPLIEQRDSAARDVSCRAWVSIEASCVRGWHDG